MFVNENYAKIAYLFPVNKILRHECDFLTYFNYSHTFFVVAMILQPGKMIR